MKKSKSVSKSRRTRLSMRRALKSGRPSKPKSRRQKMSKKVKEARRISGLRVMRRNRLIRQGIIPSEPEANLPRENTLIYQDLAKLAKLHPSGGVDDIYGFGRWKNPRTGKLQRWTRDHLELFQKLQKKK